jgi:hypothetical protein
MLDRLAEAGKYPTDAELAVAVERILAAISDVLKLVRSFSDEEWTAFKDNEDRRRRGALPAWPVVVDPVRPQSSD